MKILALDSSGLVASAAIVEDDVLIAEYTTDYKKTHSQTLLPMLDEIRQMIDLDLHTIDAIAISAGPGSFTGLRIGAATAKGLGLALDLPLVEVPTLEGLAFNLWGTDRLVCPIMDARRNQVYTGIYEFCKEETTENENTEQQLMMHSVIGQCAIAVDELVEALNRLGREVIFLGDGVPVYREQILQNLKVSCSFAPAANNRQRAASVASLGAIYYAQGKTVTAAEHEPEYLRKSQAEREREEQEKAAKEAQA
jgi:tRNA threonylcarbamoyladenosine biosynthesis protein TsaB